MTKRKAKSELRPYADLIFDSSGNLYGTSGFGGPRDQGTAFKVGLSGGVWTYTSLHDFTGNSNGGSDGAMPVASLVFDANGNLYGTTRQGGSSGAGTVFKLVPGEGDWTESIIHNFSNGSDGGNCGSNLILDANGNIYGLAQTGGAYGQGVIFEITPQQKH